jgi:hypothetical protein
MVINQSAPNIHTYAIRIRATGLYARGQNAERPRSTNLDGAILAIKYGF